MKLLYTYFWKTLPLGALIWLTPIWLAFSPNCATHLKSPKTGACATLGSGFVLTHPTGTILLKDIAATRCGVTWTERRHTVVQMDSLVDVASNTENQQKARVRAYHQERPGIQYDMSTFQESSNVWMVSFGVTSSSLRAILFSPVSIKCTLLSIFRSLESAPRIWCPVSESTTLHHHDNCQGATPPSLTATMLWAGSST